MAEPPHVWTAPGDDPDDRDAWGNPPVASPLPTPMNPPTPPSNPPRPDGQTSNPQVPSPQGPNPPVTGWGPPPGQVGQWGAQPGSSPYPGQPQWGGAPAPGNWASGRPGIVPLRPLAIGEIYDGAIRAIRSNPRTMVGFSAIVIAVLTLLATAPQAYALTTLLGSPFLDPTTAESAEVNDVVDALGASGLTLLIGVLQFVVATTIVSGLLIVAVDGAVRGQALNPGQLWARCRSRLLAIFALACVILLALPLVLLVAMLPGLIVVFIPGGKIIGVILLVLGALVGLFAFLVIYFGFWAVAAPALLLENVGVFAALRRSYRLVRGSFWRVFGIGLLTAVIAYIVRQLFSIPFAVIGGLFSTFQNDDSFGAILIQLLITDIGTVLAGAVLFPFTAGVAALLYLDLRMRREGLDVDLMRS